MSKLDLQRNSESNLKLMRNKISIGLLLALNLCLPIKSEAQVIIQPTPLAAGGVFNSPLLGPTNTGTCVSGTIVYSFTNNRNTGINNGAADQLWFCAGATLAQIISSTAVFNRTNNAIFGLSDDTNISRTAAATIVIGNGGAGDFSGTLKFTTQQLVGKIAIYNNVTTAGWGVPSIVASGRSIAQTAAVANAGQYTVGAADGSFEVSCNVLVTTATSHSFGCRVNYTDEGNTARNVFLDFATPTGFPGGSAAIVNTNGAVPYLGTIRHIRAKSGTTITIDTSGTFTTVTYNVEGSIRQIS
jgi:hypothetical protein